VHTLIKILFPFVSINYTNFKNLWWWRRRWEKYAYSCWSRPFSYEIKDKQLKVYIVKFVQWTTQCTPCKWDAFFLLNLHHQISVDVLKHTTPSTPNETSFLAMSSLFNIVHVIKALMIILIILCVHAPLITCSKNNNMSSLLQS